MDEQLAAGGLERAELVRPNELAQVGGVVAGRLGRVDAMWVWCILRNKTRGVQVGAKASVSLRLHWHWHGRLSLPLAVSVVSGHSHGPGGPRASGVVDRVVVGWIERRKRRVTGRVPTRTE